MRIVDTHCHSTPVWYEPIESLLYQMDRNDVEKAVLIQIMGNYDNEYQFECAAKYPDRISSVVMVNPNEPDALDTLEQCAERGAVGVRLVASMRSPGDDPLAIWRKADDLGLVVSCVGDAQRFASYSFASLVDELQSLSIVIEHMAGIKASAEATLPSSIDKIYELTRYPNVFMKIHGLGEFCARKSPLEFPFPFERDGLPLLHRAVDSFGPDRIMWGSDFPPVSGREGYANSLNFTMDQLSDRTEEELAAIFGGTAMRVFRLA